MEETSVLIVGAGPVGLFLANLLGRAHVACEVIERRTGGVAASMAIGIMPPSLQRFAAIGMADEMVSAGCPVCVATVLDQKRTLGRLYFSDLPRPFSFILSLPQGRLVQVLSERLSGCPTVRVRVGAELSGLDQDAETVVARVRNGDAETRVRARFVVGCDGHDSAVRRMLGVSFTHHAYRPAFVMGDFPDDTDWGAEARLFFTPMGSVESFPLPDGRRRWIALCEPGSSASDAGALARRVEGIAGMQLGLSDVLWQTSFRPYRLLCHPFYDGRVVLCGDAAHVMSPIGGQGLNTGLADAWQLAEILATCVMKGTPHAPLLAGYDRARRRAARVASGRAARGMWLGTLTGPLSSALRSLLIRQVLFRPPLRARLAPYFAMLTIPGSNLTHEPTQG